MLRGVYGKRSEDCMMLKECGIILMTQMLGINLIVLWLVNCSEKVWSLMRLASWETSRSRLKRTWRWVFTLKFTFSTTLHRESIQIYDDCHLVFQLTHWINLSKTKHLFNYKSELHCTCKLIFYFSASKYVINLCQPLFGVVVGFMLIEHV